VTEEQWKRIRDIVDPALDLPTAERATFLDHSCADDPELRKEVESLLAMEDPAKDFIETPVVVWDVEEKKTDDLPRAQRDRIGRYKIVREIGRGGMARVYEALRDDDLKMRVAIKVVKPRLLDREEVDWRFRHERRVLAGLDHPNIAKLFDGGTTEDGIPYFVMEYVEGERLTEYCRSRKLSTQERVVLFRKICSAVQYAHRKLVIHRDIKPGNIMVTPGGEPKLLDFGIAKLVDPEFGSSGGTTLPVTMPGIQPMTPGYASPEQFSGETVTTASDVYSLGVMLYELLTGHNPHRISEPVYEQFRRAAVEETPTKPSEIVGRSEVVWTSNETTVELTPEQVSQSRENSLQDLRRCLVGDLDCIVLKALRKEPEARFSSVAEFAEDLHRYLIGLPVTARRGTFSYLAGKFIKRNRASISLAVATILLLTLLGLTTYSWKVRAERAFEKKIEIIAGLFVESEGQAGVAEEEIEKMRSNIRDLRSVTERLSSIAYALAEDEGNYQVAEKMFRKVLEWETEEFGENHASPDSRRLNLAAILEKQGKYEDAEEMYLKSLYFRECHFGKESEKVFTVLNNFGALYQNTGRLEEAEALFVRGRNIGDKIYDSDHPNRAAIRNNLAFLLQAQNKYGEAEQMYLEVLGMVRRMKSNGGEQEVKKLREARVLRNLATVLVLQSRTEEAEAKAKEAFEVFYDLLVDWRIADVESVLGSSLMSLGRFDEAGDLLSRSHQVLQDRLGENARQTLEARDRLEAWHQVTEADLSVPQ